MMDEKRMEAGSSKLHVQGKAKVGKVLYLKEEKLPENAKIAVI